MEIPHTKWVKQRNLRLDKSFRDALADHWRQRWPSNTAKHAAREYGLTLDRAREGVAGRASLTTLEQVVKAGGFAAALPVLEAVIGESVANHFAQLRNAHDEQGRRVAALVGGPRTVDPDRAAGDPDAARSLDSWGRPQSHRSARGRG